jgi:(p)ppGpp synthase/HD superfamily hydrolase
MLIKQSDSGKRLPAHLQQWCSDFQHRMRSVSQSYGNPDLLEHYWKTAQVLYCGTGDEVLTKAGFAHGVDDAQALEALNPSEREVRALVDVRTSMLALSFDDPDTAVRVISSYMPRLRDYRGALLFVIDALLHADPEGKLARFSLAFHTKPQDPPKEVRAVRRTTSREAETALLTAVVAPTAGYLGLWPERNLAEDIALYRRGPDRLRELVGFVTTDRVRAEAQRRVELVRSALSRGCQKSVFWRFHHVSSVDREMRSDGGDLVYGLSKYGHVVIPCGDARACYRALADVHLSPRFMAVEREVVDHIAIAKPNGYAAILTSLIEQDSGGHGALTRIEIIERSLNRRRSTSFGHKRAGLRTPEVSAPEPGGKITVFAPDLQPKALPLGAKVINFAAAIHSTLPARVRVARVNRIQVDLLHPLKSGDIVQLEIDRQIHELPRNWKDAVPRSTIDRIRTGLNAARRDTLIALGRERVRHELRQLGVNYAEQLVDAELDTYVEAGAASIHAPEHETAWWLRQFGLLSRATSDGSLAPQMKIDQAAKDRFVKVLRERIDERPPLSRDLILMDPQVRSFSVMDLCEVCCPKADEPVVGKLKGQSLVVHRAGTSCGLNGVALRWNRTLLMSQDVVVEGMAEGSNRQGLSGEILQHAFARNLEVIDHAGTTLGPTWSVLRFRVHGVTARGLRELGNELESLPGVTRVFLPGAQVPRVLEDALPFRDDLRAPFAALLNPYPDGCEIRDDAHYYGRRGELAQIQLAWEHCTERGGHGGSIVVVSGPLKVGKTSLANRFCRLVRRSQPECAIIKTYCPLDCTWESVDSDLKRKLKAELRTCGENDPTADDDGQNPSARELASRLLARGRSLVLYVDEAPRALAARGKPDTAIYDFLSWILNTPGIILLLVGPEADFRRLPNALTLTLRGAVQVSLRPFSCEEVLALMRAERTGNSNATIAAKPDHAHRLWRETAGNPYWCSLVCHRVYEKADHGSVLVYSRPILDEAISWLVANREEVFQDRFYRSHWHPADASVARSLLTLLKDGPPPFNQRGAAPEQAILEAVTGTVPGVDRQSILGILDDLCSCGTLQPDVDTEGRKAWKLAAPILRRFMEKRPDFLERIWRNADKE